MTRFLWILVPVFGTMGALFGKAPSSHVGLYNTVTEFRVGGHLGERLDANERSWIQPLLENNPNLFGAFMRPDSNRLFKCMWHGEFPGKILTGVAQTYLTSHAPETRAVGDRMVDSLARAQREDGYLGPWSDRERFDNLPEKWDTWGHYHCMYGLLMWHKVTGSEKALEVACRAADCMYDYFIRGKIFFASQNWGECNFAPSHIFALLYEETRDPRYLEAAEYIVQQEWKVPYHDFYTNSTLACNWLEAALDGIPFCHSPQKRWESLYTLTSLYTLYCITGKQQYADAMESLWWGIVQYDRHNTGSFGTGEGATGDIYGTGSETCNTVAWMTFSTEYLKLSRNSYVADELELSLFNAMLGSQLGDKEFVYMNSSDGVRVSSQIELAPHSFEGGREMNCCQASGNRGLSHFTRWGVLNDDENIYLNYYGESQIRFETPAGRPIEIEQQTDYPKSGSVRISVLPERAERFGLCLRIPVWSHRTIVKVNGVAVDDVEPGRYLRLERKWRSGDVVELELDMRIHYWVGAERVEGKSSVYYGPVLLSIAEPADQVARYRFTPESFEEIEWVDRPGHWFSAQIRTMDGKSVEVEDYATKPAEKSYTTWLPVETTLPRATFDRNGAPVWDY